MQRQFIEALDYAYERDTITKAQELRKAREDGDYDSELRVQSELDTLRFQHNQVRQEKNRLPANAEVQAEQPKPAENATAQQATQQKPAQQPAPHPLAVKWIADNKTWFRNPQFEEHQAAVLRIDAKLKAEGYDPTGKDYYQELDERVDRLFPGLRKKRKATSNPVAPAGNSPAAGSKKNVVKLTRVDLENMRRFGLDPSNKEQLREYALNKTA